MFFGIGVVHTKHSNHTDPLLFGNLCLPTAEERVLTEWDEEKLACQRQQENHQIETNLTKKKEETLDTGDDWKLSCVVL